MDYKKLSKIIPFDDLHWFEEDGKFASISPEELDSILENCLLNGLTEEESTKVVRWAEQMRTGNLMLNGLLSKRLSVIAIANDEPIFSSTSEIE